MLNSQGFACIGPFKRVSPLFVVLANVKHDLVNEFFLGVPDATADDIAAKDVKPDFHLVEP